MRLPRPRLTVRRSMLLVAFVAVLITSGMARYRYVAYRGKATACVALAELMADGSKRMREWAVKFPNRSREYEEKARRFDRRAAFFRRWEIIWRDASNHPWRVGPTPEPAPE